MTDSTTTNRKPSHTDLNRKIIQFEQTFKNSMKSKIESINKVQKESELLNLNNETSIEKYWELICNLSEKKEKMDFVLTEARVFIQSLENSINKDEGLKKKLDKNLSLLRDRCIEYSLFFKKSILYRAKMMRNFVDKFKKELYFSKNIERKKIDKILDEIFFILVMDENIDAIKEVVNLSKEIKTNLKRNFKFTNLAKAIDNANGNFVIIRIITEILISQKEEYNIIDSDGNTTLHHAVIVGDFFTTELIVLELSKENKNINPKNYTGITPLHLSAANCDSDIFNLLLDNLDNQGENLNPKIEDDDRTVLHMLAEKKEFKLFENLVKKLMNKNENINPSGINGVTPLHIAVEHNNEEIIKLLIEKIKIQKGVLSPKALCGKVGITPFFFAAYNGYFNLVELFLKENTVSTEEINPITKSGITLLQLAITLEKVEVVKKMLQVLFHSENYLTLRPEERCEAFVFTNAIKKIDLHLEMLKNAESSLEKFCMGILVYTAIHRKHEIAKRVVLFLEQNKSLKFMNQIIKQANNIRTLKPKDHIFFLEIKKFIMEKQKKTKRLRESKVSGLEKILTDKKILETINKNKSLLEGVQKRYDALFTAIQQGIKCLEESKDEVSIEEKSQKIKENLNELISEYKEYKNKFLIKEEELKHQAKIQAQKLLRPFKEQIEFSIELLEKSKKALAYKMSEKTQSEKVELTRKDLAAALAACHLEIDKTQYLLSTTIQDKFKVLSECNRALLSALIVFGGKDRENKEKEIAHKKKEEAKLLEREIEKITVRLSAELEVTSSFIQESIAYFNKFDSASELISDMLKEKINFLKVDLLNFQEKQKTILLKNKKEIQQNTVTQEKTELEWRFSLIRLEVFNYLQVQRKNLEKEWLSKVEEIQEILSLVLKNNLYNSVISNKEDELYSLCERYKKHFNYLEKIKISINEFDSNNDLSKEYKRIIDLNANLLKRKKWLEKKTEEVRSVDQELTLRAFNETKIKVDDSQLPKEVYLPSFQQKTILKSKSKRKSTPLLGGYLEVERANKIIELLDSDKNTNRDLTVKKNAIFLAIAMICESLKRSESKKLLKKSATNVRNAIYHALIEDKIDEEKYQQVMSFTKNVCHKGIVNKLESFFEIFPKTQPNYVNYISMIHTHIQFLGQYYEKIENNAVNIQEDLVLQSDIAFRLAQIFALQTDLSKARNNENKANKNMRSQLQEMFKKLNMKKSMFRSLANEVRHGGVEGVNIAINEWIMAVGGALSEDSFRRDNANLNTKMARLSL